MGSISYGYDNAGNRTSVTTPSGTVTYTFDDLNRLATATDPTTLSNSDNATFEVTAVNDPPVVGDIPDQSGLEGSSFNVINLDNYVTDPDNTDSEITWTASATTDITVSINATNRQATITANDVSWNGTETVTFTAEDPGGLTHDNDASFSYTFVNDAPQWMKMLGM